MRRELRTPLGKIVTTIHGHGKFVHQLLPPARDLAIELRESIDHLIARGDQADDQVLRDRQNVENPAQSAVEDHR
jgi:hypothetical protein